MPEERIALRIVTLLVLAAMAVALCGIAECQGGMPPGARGGAFAPPPAPPVAPQASPTPGTPETGEQKPDKSRSSIWTVFLTAMIIIVSAALGAVGHYFLSGQKERLEELSNRIGQLNSDVQSYDADVRALTSQVDSARIALNQAGDDFRDCDTKVTLYQQDLQGYRTQVTHYEREDQALISDLIHLAMELEPLEDQLKAWIGFADMPQQDREQATRALANEFNRLRDLRDKGPRVQTSELRDWLHTVGLLVEEVTAQRTAEDAAREPS